jgi:ABC-type xylose transport system permease subunit
MGSGMVAAVLPVSVVLVGVAALAWGMLRERSRRQAPTAGAQPHILLGLLILAAFAMGAFLTYALLSVR